MYILCHSTVQMESLTSPADQLLGLVDLGSEGPREQSARQPRLVHALLRGKCPLLLRGGRELEDSNDLLDGLCDGHHYVVPGGEGRGEVEITSVTNTNCNYMKLLRAKFKRNLIAFFYCVPI